MARSSSLTVTIRISGVDRTLRAFRALPKDASNELRDSAKRLSEKMAVAARAAGAAEGRQAAAVASTVKATRDRVPVVTAGGTKRLGRNRKPAFKLLFGSEFGATVLRQYKPHLGRGSYWFFQTIEDEAPAISVEWNRAADTIIRKFGGGF